MDHTVDQTITWNPNGYKPGDIVTVISPPPNQWFAPSVTIKCNFVATDGAGTMPAALLRTQPDYSGDLGTLQLTLLRPRTVFQLPIVSGATSIGIMQFAGTAAGPKK